MHSDSVQICTETFCITLEIPRAKSDADASLQFDHRPMALPYGRERRLAGLILVLARNSIASGDPWRAERLPPGLSDGPTSF
jgi:hypothetical protein